MAQATTNFDYYPKAGILTRIAARVLEWMDNYAENHPLMRQVRSLQALSDEELAKRGIARQDIVREVFGHRFYA